MSLLRGTLWQAVWCSTHGWFAEGPRGRWTYPSHGGLEMITLSGRPFGETGGSGDDSSGGEGEGSWGIGSSSSPIASTSPSWAKRSPEERPRRNFFMVSGRAGTGSPNYESVDTMVDSPHAYPMVLVRTCMASWIRLHRSLSSVRVRVVQGSSTTILRAWTLRPRPHTVAFKC